MQRGCVFQDGGSPCPFLMSPPGCCVALFFPAEIHIAYAAAGDLTKKDLVNAEAEGCWVYGFRIARPTKQSIAHARSRHVPLFAFRHHQHLLDHLQHHIEQSPTLTKSGEAKLDQPFTTKRRSHPTVQ